MRKLVLILNYTKSAPRQVELDKIASYKELKEEYAFF